MDAEVDFVDLVIKFGGSAITEKDTFETAKLHNIARACQVVRQCKDAGKRIVVLHGGGSFGHHQAKKDDVNLGFKGPGRESCDPDRVKRGFCATRQSITMLQAMLIEEMMTLGLPVVALGACGVWLTNNAAVVRSGISQMMELVHHGFIPVLHGDCVIDETLGCYTLSGDTIIETLCKEVQVRQVVFLTDVDGIYDRPPSHIDAKRLDTIFISPNGEIELPIEVADVENDVTGGMRLKLQTAINIVVESQGKTDMFICNICSDVALNVCLHGVKCANGHGTLVKLKQC